MHFVKMNSIIAFGLVLFGFLVADLKVSIAHEGHDHGAAAVQKSPDGGNLKVGKNYSISVSESGGMVTLYVYTKDLKPVLPSAVQVTAYLTIPKKTKRAAVAFEAKEKNFSAKVDAKGAHRYMLDVQVGLKGAKPETLKVQIEPNQ